MWSVSSIRSTLQDLPAGCSICLRVPTGQGVSPKRKQSLRWHSQRNVVSKLVGSLVVAGKLTSIPETSNPRIRRLNTTDSGKDLVRRLNAAVLNTPPPRPRPTDAGAKGESNAIDFDIAESLGSCVSATKGLDARKRRRRT